MGETGMEMRVQPLFHPRAEAQPFQVFTPPALELSGLAIRKKPFEVSYLLYIFVFIDAWRQGRRKPLIDVWLPGKLLEQLHTFLGEKFLLCFFIKAMQTL